MDCVLLHNCPHVCGLLEFTSFLNLNFDPTAGDMNQVLPESEEIGSKEKVLLSPIDIELDMLYQCKDDDRPELLNHHEMTEECLSALTEYAGYEFEIQKVSEPKAAAEYNKNIMNAYLLLKYKYSIKYPLGWDYAAIAYITVFVQFQAMLFLTIAIVRLGGVQMTKDYHFQEQPIGGGDIVWPFFFIGFIIAVEKMQIVMLDWKMFSKFFMSIQDKKKKRKLKREVYFLKSLEAFMMICGVLGFFTVIALYSPHDEWNGILNSILNLLAYEFILSLDECVFDLLYANLRKYYESNGHDSDFKNVFRGAPGTLYLNNKSKRVSFWMGLIWSILLLLLYSNSLWALVPLVVNLAMNALALCFIYLILLSLCSIKSSSVTSSGSN